eukprot:1982921-Amphidinium_carterae.1
MLHGVEHPLQVPLSTLAPGPMVRIYDKKAVAAIRNGTAEDFRNLHDKTLTSVDTVGGVLLYRKRRQRTGMSSLLVRKVTACLIIESKPLRETTSSHVREMNPSEPKD